jgi:hypothetical protein
MGEPDARRRIPWAILGCDEDEEMADAAEDSCAANVDMETHEIATTTATMTTHFAHEKRSRKGIERHEHAKKDTRREKLRARDGWMEDRVNNISHKQRKGEGSAEKRKVQKKGMSNEDPSSAD